MLKLLQFKRKASPGIRQNNEFKRRIIKRLIKNAIKNAIKKVIKDIVKMAFMIKLKLILKTQKLVRFLYIEMVKLLL